MAKEKKKKKVSDIIITIIIFLVVAAFLVAIVRLFLNLVNDDNKSKNAGKSTEVQQLIDKNLDDDYPLTPREVVKVYCKITKQLYYGKCSDDQIQKLYVQMRKLFDEELLSNNKYEDNYNALVSDLGEYTDKKIKVVNYALQDIDDVHTYLYEGRENAMVKVTFSIKEKNEWQKLNEEFIVRKDEEGRWKILGWQTSDTAVNGNEED